MMKNRAGWLALIVLAIASLLMIFVVMPRINNDGKPIGEAINAAGDAVKDAVTEGKAPDAAEKPAETAKADPQASAPAATPASPAPGSSAPTSPASASPAAPDASGNGAPAASTPSDTATAADVPTFDVLRVEPDGSAVIAGHAAPNSTLEITNGASVVAKLDVGPSGDFAAVLDNPLPPGDHQLVLKATAKDGKVTTSEEIATVSVPADKSGKLLAMVTKPGKASRLIAVPQEPGQAASTAQPTTTPSTDAASAAPAGAETSAPAANPAATAPATAGSQDIASAAAVPARPTTASEVQISAVEIEGSKIFIAGVAKSGIRVRGSADGSVVGQSQAGNDGHFVIEGSANLTVGDHRIAVEALGSAGQVLVRVEVPFNRPAGEQVAAVASPSPASPATSTDGGAFDNLRNELAKAFSLLKALYAEGKEPSLESMAAARSATGIALQSLSEYRLPAGAPVSATDVVGAAARSAGAARQALDALPRDVAAVGEALNDLTRMISEAIGPALARQLNGEQPLADASTGGARMIEQAPLTQSERSSVIIRRGDTLWQIARRAYGQGVRYTTIYLANEAQITNPDIIQPGQIFGVPSDYRPDSEELHRERLMHRKG
ncbi:LysM peptidoglycan-binding domain-containing protein [Aliirhizobium terrae]|uniref:LysM peptidoglycan-binding domain-containing protein n=1 Tax=Terrirhizobium terrae TaxID=2926709 RepID=UPI002575C2D9|nr:LysM peptidoglycan-binding domain-containing protein [Rhizobium sp. CC-CFT758]WJH39513.1 LysM peptidoglycan-binding domain-containing protein [Rhizobium sp. CC-CFT758]